MNERDQFLTSEINQMLIASMIEKGNHPLREIEVERFSNSLTRAQSGVPTGVSFDTKS